VIVSPERARELASMPYEDYLRTPEWRERSAACKRRAGHRCQLCNTGGMLHAHHRTYERRGNEEEGDLIALCDGCHRGHHNRARKTARPAPIGVTRDVPGATLWTIPARRPLAAYRLRVLPKTRRRWRESGTAARVAWVLVLAGAGLLSLVTVIRPA
jgi:hypothetical protein